MKKELNPAVFAGVIAVVVVLVAVVLWKSFGSKASGKGDGNQTDPSQYAARMKGMSGGSSSMMGGSNGGASTGTLPAGK